MVTLFLPSGQCGSGGSYQRSTYDPSTSQPGLPRGATARGGGQIDPIFQEMSLYVPRQKYDLSRCGACQPCCSADRRSGVRAVGEWRPCLTEYSDPWRGKSVQANCGYVLAQATRQSRT